MIAASEMRLAATPAIAPVGSEILQILPVSSFKSEHRILHGAEDVRIQEAIQEAYARLDGPSGYLNRAILTQTWVGVLDRLDDEIEIPLPPLQAVTGVRYRDADGNWQTLSTDIYGVDVYGLVGKIYRKMDQLFPDVHKDPGSVEITFRAGWGDGAAVLAAAVGVRKGMKLLAGHFYHNPSPTFVEPRLVEVPRKIHYGLNYVLSALRIVNDPS